MSISISLCMIVKNEEDVLDDCLSSVQGIADEINIVDTGSTDRTVEIAKRYTDRVFYFEWVDDFAKARNFSFSKATKDYILWLDADDIIIPENREKFLKLKETLPTDIKYVLMPYHCLNYDDGTPSLTSVRERLVKNNEGFKWEYPIHEVINASGKHQTSDISIKHNKHHTEDDVSFERNIDIIKKSIDAGDNSVRTLAYYAISLNSAGRTDEALEQIERLLPMVEKTNATLSVQNIYVIAHEIYLKRGNDAAALKVLLDNEHFMRDKSEYYCYLGAYYLNGGNPQKAINYFKRALKCGGTEITGRISMKYDEFYYFQPLRAIAHCYIKLGQLDKAMEYCKRAFECVPRSEDAMLNICLTEHEVYFEKGDYDKALKVLLDNERYLNGKSEYFCALGAFYNFKQDTLKAMEYFVMALGCKAKKKKGDFLKEQKKFYYFEPLRSIANCCIRLKQYEEALKYFKMALEYEPSDKTTLSIVEKLERMVELMKPQ